VTLRGVGIDLVEIDRVQQMLDRHGDRARRRLLLPAERVYCEGKARPAQHVAARIAAKEAAFKALQAAGHASHVSWLDIEVLMDDERRPSLRYHGAALDAAARLGVSRSLVSLSHSIDTAVAVVVLDG
jgi:holo-[acyl-carrier protein] synthase